jgi:hypothetical protein
LWKTQLLLKALRSEVVQRGVLGSAFDVCFADSVACMVRLWYLATGRVSESNSDKRLNLKFMAGRVSLSAVKDAIKHVKGVTENTSYFQ